MMKRLFAAAFLLTASIAHAACHAVTVAGAGSKDGSSWSNAMQKLPTAPVRGDTYYLADGSYGTYTPTTATSGTSRITIKKAQTYDYGRTSDGCSNDVSGGWNPTTMGASQAIFSGTGGTVSTTGGQGYFTFDGNGKTATAGCGVSPAVNAAASDCGIKIMAASTSATTYGVLWINSNYDSGATRASGWIVRYVELVGAGDAGNSIVNSNEHTLYCRNGCNNFLFEHNYAHDSACDFIDTPYGDTATYNLNHFKQNASSANCHGQFWLGDGNQMNNFTFSNNLIQDIQGTGYWSVLNGGKAATWNIYNNIIFQLPGSSRPGVSSGTFVVANSGSSATGINVIDNTWVGDKTDYSNHFTPYCDGTCTGTYTERGSLYYGIIDSQDNVNPSPVAGPGVFPNAVESYNSVLNSGTVNFGYAGTGDIKSTGQANPFVNWPNYNFNLTGNSANVVASLSLASPFNVDAVGIARPSGGVWNRGALQFPTATPGVWGPGGFIYNQIDADGASNDYPLPVLAGQQISKWVQPIFEQQLVPSWSSDGSLLTIPAPGTTAQVEDMVRLRNFAGQGAIVSCQVWQTTSSTITFLINPSLCDSDIQSLFPSGSGTSSTGYYQIINGPNRNANGTWEVVDTSSGGVPVTAFLQNTKQDTNGSGTPCNPDLHTATCYQGHPTLLTASRGVYVQMGPNEPASDCSYTSLTPPNTFPTFASPMSFNLKWTSAADSSKTISIPYLVCNDGAGSGKKGNPRPGPAYRQSYTNQQHPIFNVNWATSDQYTIWSITSDDGLGDATLETFAAPAGDTFVKNGGKLPEAIVHTGTKTDGYTINACSDKDPSSCMWTRWYVVNGVPPSLNPDKVEFTPCAIDPVMVAAGGTVYEVGPGQAFAGPMNIPTNNYPWGSIVRIHGETGTPGNPVTIHNYWEMKLPPNYLAHTNTQVPALYQCGIPDSSGQLPVIDGQDATGNTQTGQFTGLGQLATINGAPPSLPQSDNYHDGLQPFHHVGIANIRFQNATVGVSYYLPGQLPPSGNKSTFSNSEIFRPFVTQLYSVIGTRAINVANPYFSDCTSKGGYLRNCSPDGYYEGNHAEGYGIPGDFTEHPMYLQDVRDFWVLGLLDGAVPGSNGTNCYSFRGNRAFYISSTCRTVSPYGAASIVGGDAEVQDNVYYVDPNRAFGPTAFWDHSTCSDGSSNYPFCSFPGMDAPPAFGGLATFAAFQQEHQYSFFLIGNNFNTSGGGCGTSLAMTNSDNSLAGQHNGFYSYNNIICPYTGPSLFEDVRNGSIGGNSNDAQPVDWPKGFFANNIIWWNSNTGCSYGGCTVHDSQPTGMVNFQTNVVHTGQFSLATGIQQQIGVRSGNNGSGLNESARYYDEGGARYAEEKIGGWSNPANFIFTPTIPYSSSNQVPFLASPAVGVASALHYPASLYPPMFNAVDVNNAQTRRMDLTTAGPLDPSGGPTLTSIAITPGGPINLLYPAGAQMTATCTYSDSSTTNCTNAVTWSNGGSTSFTISSTGLISSLNSIGSGTVSATLLSINSNNVTVNVATPAPPQVLLKDGAKVGLGSGTDVKIF